jgi:hypothetical protein
MRPGQKLSDTYEKVNLAVLRRRLYQAGVRLTMVLDEAFPEK